jgi:TPR repeat protein/uncharacterized caspase-like protein
MHVRWVASGGVVGLVLGLMTAASLAQESLQPRKVALLVGVNQYHKPGFRDLQFAEADVLAVAAELQKLDFQTTVLLGSAPGERQATLANIEAAAWKLVAPLGKRDVVLVMLSGHGQTLPRTPDAEALDESYYCPVDAVLNDPRTQFSLSHLLDDILAPNVGRKLVLVDACRDVPQDLTRGARNTKGIEGRIVALPEDTAIFFSCRAGQLSFERSELGHGLFTFCVLEGLRGAAVQRGELSWSSLVAHVGRRMTEPELTRYMPRSLPQVPILAGAMPHTVLGVVEEAPAVVRATPVAPSAAVTPAAPPPFSPRDQALQRDLRDFETALFTGSGAAKTFFATRAAQRLDEWRTAADEGAPMAQFFLARCLQHGVGMAVDEAAAMELYRRAGEGGVGLAWNALGAAHETGRGVEKNFVQAAECYHRGGDLGCATAMYNLAYLYEEGYGVPKSLTQAFDWYRRAAEAGEPGAMFKTGYCYNEGLGVERNLALARQWYEKAVARGSTAAMNNLGLMYDNGTGVVKDPQEARRLYEMAAERGNATAMNNLGAMYHNGTGVAKDRDKALEWYRKAWKALEKNPDAKTRRILLENFKALNASP